MSEMTKLREKIRRYLRLSGQFYDTVAVIPDRLYNECQDCTLLDDVFGDNTKGKRSLWFECRTELLTVAQAKAHLERYQKIIQIVK